MQPAPLSYRQELPELVEPLNGKDEMNLAEFPLAKLGKRDTRKVITYERRFTSDEGATLLQKWEVHGAIKLGLPDETGDRVMVALMTLTAQQGFRSPKVTFSPYRILQMLDLTDGAANYKALRNVIRQLVGLTIYSEKAFLIIRQKKE